MISVVYNDVLNGIEMHLDAKGAELLMKKLQNLSKKSDHVHLYETNDDLGLSGHSPYRESRVFGELVLNLLPSEAWKESK